MKLYLIIPILFLGYYFIPHEAYKEEVELPKNIKIFDDETIKIAEVIKQKETRGNCNAKGASGEIGCMQYLPSTWNSLTKKYYGEVKGYSTTTEDFITYKQIEELQLKNIPINKIFQYHNQGTYTKPCIRGVNKWGVKYDSCAYVKDAMRIYESIK